MGLYAKSQKGTPIIQLIQTDWNVFNISSLRIQQKLLKIISCNPSIFRTKYKPVFAQEQNNIEQWEKFREELKHRNRFFPKDAPLINHLEPFGKYIGIIHDIGTQKFYRARINSSDKPFKISEMGKPDKNIASSGRANPIGIPYLYVASTIEAAIAEVRGHKGEIVTIAEFQIIDKLELADLRTQETPLVLLS